MFAHIIMMAGRNHGEGSGGWRHRPLPIYTLHCENAVPATERTRPMWRTWTGLSKTVVSARMAAIWTTTAIVAEVSGRLQGEGGRPPPFVRPSHHGPSPMAVWSMVTGAGPFAAKHLRLHRGTPGLVLTPTWRSPMELTVFPWSPRAPSRSSTWHDVARAGDVSAAAPAGQSGQGLTIRLPEARLARSARHPGHGNARGGTQKDEKGRSLQLPDDPGPPPGRSGPYNFSASLSYVTFSDTIQSSARPPSSAKQPSRYRSPCVRAMRTIWEYGTHPSSSTLSQPHTRMRTTLRYPRYPSYP